MNINGAATSEHGTEAVNAWTFDADGEVSCPAHGEKP